MGSEKEGEKVEKLLELANPVVDYLQRNFHPHTTVERCTIFGGSFKLKN